MQSRESYLDFNIQYEGRGRVWLSRDNRCSNCNTTSGDRFRCVSCDGGYPYCKSCLLSTHALLPLHIIEVSKLVVLFTTVTDWYSTKKWDSTSGHFVKISLRSLGLRYQLGHIPGDYCSAPKAGHTNFMVINNDALHSVAIDYCGCPGSPVHHAQLLEIGWWPSTTQEPQTVGTFNALRQFHVINLRGHLSPTDYYRAIEELTDGTGLQRPSVGYSMIWYYISEPNCTSGSTGAVHAHFAPVAKH